MHYELPPNDPRYLAMTDDDMLYDLLVVYYHRRRKAEAEAPEETAVERFAQDTEAGRRMEERTSAFLDDPQTQIALQRLWHGGTPEERERAKLPRAIRIGRRTTPR